MTNICGHDRKTLQWSLRVQRLVDRGLPAMLPSAWTDQATALNDILDPAKLATIIAELMRERGVDVTIISSKNIVVSKWNDGAVDKRWFLEMPQARAFALALLDAPNASTQDVERMIGEL